MKKGFTILELLIVVVILGVLAGLTIPVYQAAIEKSRAQEAIQMLSTIRESMLRYYSIHGTYWTANMPSVNYLWPSQSGDENLDFDPNAASASGGQTPHFWYYLAYKGANGFLINAVKGPMGTYAAPGEPWGNITIDQAGTITKYGIFA